MDKIHYTFPDNFTWGAIASAYQIEGAWDEDGKGVSIWDQFSRLPDRVLNGDTGEIATDHYHKMPDDVLLMKEIGLKSYSFTLSWPRILPEGTGKVNQKGLDFYDRLVDNLLKAGIRPKATLYHWDYPLALQERGGWPCRDSVNWFGEYALVVFDKLADRVDLWATHNEPWVAAFLGYGAGIHAPGINDATQAYQAAHNLMLAHAKAVEIYRSGNYGGEIGLILNLNHLISGSEREEDIQATQRVYDETHSLFLDPIFLGKYPEKFLEWLGPNQPRIEPGDLALLKGTADYLGINHYNSDYVFYDHFGGLLKARLEPYSAPGWGVTQTGWGINPAGLKSEVMNIVENYGHPKILLTENGCAAVDKPDKNGFVNDLDRIRFLKAHIIALHDAIQEGA
ncbi:MAG: family 1 glycosylhydrolase, partial [Anaerolineales bacterium]|nr:family 1 glycosylhydrolase [Anaerolineales bacterium]